MKVLISIVVLSICIFLFIFSYMLNKSIKVEKKDNDLCDDCKNTCLQKKEK